MRIELNVTCARPVLNMRIAAELPIDTGASIRAIVRHVLDLQLAPGRAALRLIWAFAEYPDDYSGCAIFVDLTHCTVHVACGNREEHYSFADFTG